MYPAFARRRQISLMCSWTPKISCTTSTVGNLEPFAGIARVGRNLAISGRDLHFTGSDTFGISGDC